MFLKAAFCLFLLILTFSYVNCLDSDVVFWSSPHNGNWEDDTNWSSNSQPTTKNIVSINVNYKISVSLSSNRYIEALSMSLGNELVLNSGVELTLGPAVDCTPGSYVNPATGLCVPCSGNSYQSLSDQSFCTSCTQYNKVANSSETGCSYCKAGYIFNSETQSCQSCPAYHSSDGQGGDCLCCPAGTSSTAGGVCTICPAGQVSNTCGPCVACLPKPQDTNCPTHDGITCGGLGTCNFANDTLGIYRGICSCDFLRFGSACQFFIFDFSYPNIFSVFEGDSIQIFTPTSPDYYNDYYYQSGFSYQYNLNLLQTAELISGKGIGIYASFPSIAEVVIAVTELDFKTPFEFKSLSNPNTSAPTGWKPTNIGFNINAWSGQDNSIIQQYSSPIYFLISYNAFFTTPVNLGIFYFNVEINQWVEANFACGTEYNNIIYQNQGVIAFPSLQVSGEFWIFKKIVNVIPTPIQGGYNFGGKTRVETTTTQLTGIIPQPSTRPAPVAPVSQPQHFGNSGTVIIPSVTFSLMLVTLSIVLFFIGF